MKQRLSYTSKVRIIHRISGNSFREMDVHLDVTAVGIATAVRAVAAAVEEDAEHAEKVTITIKLASTRR